MDAELINEIYQKILNSQLVYNVNLAAQILCASVVIYTLLHKLLLSTAKSKNAKLQPWDIILPIVIVALIFMYNYILEWMDWFAVELEKIFTDFSPGAPGYARSVDVFAKASETATDMEEVNGINAVVYYAQRIWNYITHPGIWIMESGRNIFLAIDMLIFGIALIKRAFRMFILRVVGSFSLLASMHKRYEGFAANWIMLYMLNYLYVGVLYIINYFCEYAFHAIREAKLSGVEDEHGFMTTLAYIAVLFVKIGMYRKSYDFLKEIFSNPK
jgi:hypothetical protein